MLVKVPPFQPSGPPSDVVVNDASAAADAADSHAPNYVTASSSGFEGPEKLLELWFYPNAEDCGYDPTDPTSTHTHGDCGLRKVARPVWEDMLDLVHCKVLSVISNEHMDAYLLSESSMFVHSHKLILKTCGTTTLLHAIPRILEIAHKMCGLTYVDSCFYSRKSFMFPDKQTWPHGSWADEVKYLDLIFNRGHFHTSAYIVGKTNDDHWNLYIATPKYSKEDEGRTPEEIMDLDDEEEEKIDAEMDRMYQDDITLEVLMTDLNPEKMKMFYSKGEGDDGPRVYHETGMDEIYPHSVVDSFLFDPCGFSLNGMLGPYYWTVHVTPEDHCSYASLESNIPITAIGKAPDSEHDLYGSYEEVVRKVVEVFEPGKFTCTLFSRKPDELTREESDSESVQSTNSGGSGGGTPVITGTVTPASQATVGGKPERALSPARSRASSAGSNARSVLSLDPIIAQEHARMLLSSKTVVEGFRRRDRIVFDLGRWDLVFSQFALGKKHLAARKPIANGTANGLKVPGDKDGDGIPDRKK
ncbi:S-adenosylmethionine decarboxylase [Hyaloraphidium curvatum]|nr:S-adenosylmethionine decarboxylase [Hyaloraphidium curvatum]